MANRYSDAAGGRANTLKEKSSGSLGTYGMIPWSVILSSV